MNMNLIRIDTGIGESVRVPDVITLTKAEGNGLIAWVSNPSKHDWLDAVSSWAYRRGYEPPEELQEAEVQVKAHTRKDPKTGKIEDVDAFTRTVDDIAPDEKNGFVGAAYHGGQPSNELGRFHYFTVDKDVAQSYVDMYNDRVGSGGAVHIARISIKKPAPWSTIRAQALNQGVSEDDLDMYTPASFFDKNLFDAKSIAKVVSKLKKLGYDGAVLKDIAYGKEMETDAIIPFNKVEWSKKKLTESYIRILGEALVKVKAHKRKDKKTGKIEDVDAFVRNVKGKLELTDQEYDPDRIRHVPTKIYLSKTQTGKIGEQIAIQMKGGIQVNQFLGIKKNNLPYDVINVSKRKLYEVKAGVISNKRDDQKWRLTKGEPSKEEKKWLKKASPSVKAMYHKGKDHKILARKLAFQQMIEEKTGKKFTVKTLTFVLNPDKRIADSYEFEGLHPIIRWHNPLARKGYKRTVKY